MNIDSIPEAFQSKIRLAVIASLIAGEKTFNEIKEVTKTTDGNLSTHLSRLEEIYYIKSRKEFIGKKPCSTYSITETGRDEFEKYVKLLENLLKGSKDT